MSEYPAPPPQVRVQAYFGEQRPIGAPETIEVAWDRAPDLVPPTPEEILTVLHVMMRAIERQYTGEGT